MNKIDLSVVIPVYRSADILHTLVGRLLGVLNSLGGNYEIILVDDGSPDHAWEVLSALQQSHPDRVVAIQLMRNYGQHNALMCGLRHSRGTYILTMDDDLQHPPEEIPKLVEAIEANGWDLVYAIYDHKKHRTGRNIGSALANSFFKLVFKSRIGFTSFRIIRRELLDSIFSYSLNFTYVDGLLAWNTQRVGQVVVEHHTRLSGGSSYSLRKLGVLTLNLLTNFSLLPLQVVSLCGVLASSGGFALGIYYLIHYLVTANAVPGFASLMITILVLGGIQLLSLGIMGEYLGRLHLNVNRKPQYVERHVLAAHACGNSDNTSKRELRSEDIYDNGGRGP
jgi:undecaprenyl-phosphate 4-deoxy-4-formamido-L-arabinose transferase